MAILELCQPILPGLDPGNMTSLLFPPMGDEDEENYSTNQNSSGDFIVGGFLANDYGGLFSF